MVASAMFTPRQLALHAARLASDKGGDAIRILQLPAASGQPFDFAVLATARSDRQTNAIVEEIYHFCKRHGVARMPVEGESGWMLIDCYDVVVHAMTEEVRQHYQIDTLWPLARDLHQWEKEAKELVDPDKPVSKPKRAPAKKVVEVEAEAEAEEDVVPPAPKRKTKKLAEIKVEAEAAPKRKPKAVVAPVVEAEVEPAPKRRRAKVEPEPEPEVKSEPKKRKAAARASKVEGEAEPLPVLPTSTEVKPAKRRSPAKRKG